MDCEKPALLRTMFFQSTARNGNEECCFFVCFYVSAKEGKKNLPEHMVVFFFFFLPFLCLMFSPFDSIEHGQSQTTVSEQGEKYNNNLNFGNEFPTEKIQNQTRSPF
jgi:hypothetical protein